MNDELTELRSELATLRAEVEASRRRIADLEARRDRTESTAPPNREPTSRRAALRLAAGSVAAATGAVLASSPAAADDPNDITLGQNKVHSGGVTRAGNTGTTDAMAFLFVAGTEGVGSGSLAPAALGGWSSQTERPNGIYGFTDQNGAGVVGVCRRNASPIFVDSHVGVFGWTDTAFAAGVHGESITLGPGVFGNGDVGVRGVGNALGVGVDGICPSGFGGQFIGQRAGVNLFDPDSAVNSAAPYGSNPGSFGTRNQGELLYASDALSEEVVDQGLWVCVEPGDPGSWRCLAGPDSAGTLFPVTPFRVYDSRLDMAPDPDGPLVEGASRTLSAADARNVSTGAVAVTDAVPAGARSVAFNLTVDGTAGGGFVFLAPGGTTEVSASTVNWTPGGSTTVANAGIVGLDEQRRLTVLCGGSPDASAQVIVDITGYYL